VATKVLYLIGAGRSSSTLINNILGEVPDVFGAGEVGSLWRFGYLEGRTCACGAHVSECEIWGPVIKRVGASAGSGLTPDDIVGIQDRYLRERHIGGLLTSAIGIPRRMPPDLQRYTKLATEVIVEAAEISGAKLLVDASKAPGRAALIGLSDDIDLHFLHIVRDPRAVAFSWHRVRADRAPSRNLMASSLHWTTRNLATELLRRRLGTTYTLLRYEDFVAQPREALRPIVVSFGMQHAISGRPAKFRSGAQEVRADEEWRLRQGGLARTVSSAISFPLLHRYGYPWRVPKPAVVLPEVRLKTRFWSGGRSRFRRPARDRAYRSQGDISIPK
jgi:hypothetical protein